MARQKYSDEYLIERLKHLGEILGRTPKCEDLIKHENMPSRKAYSKHFGTWNNALTEAGFKLNMIRNYTKEEIIKEVQDFYALHNRSPYYNELKYSKTVIRNYWKNWDMMLKSLGLPPNRNIHELKTKEDGIDLLRRIYEKTKKIPTTTYIQNELKINKGWFTSTFGSFRKALYEAGLVGKEYTFNKEKLVIESINIIKKLYSDLGKVPTASDYDQIVKGTGYLNRKALESNLNLRFAEICNKYIGEANQLKKNKDTLLIELIQLKEKLGRIPRIQDLKENGLSEFKQYTRTFNKTFSEILEDLGWELDYVRPKHKTDEELLRDYKYLYEELGRIPLREDLNNDEKICNYNTYKNRFGDLRVVWETLEIEYVEDLASHSLGMGYTCIDNNGDVCRSYSEMIITNYLIKRRIKYIKEYPYSKLIINDDSKKRFDWYLPDYNICVEYFGLFDKNQVTKDNWVGKYSRKVLEKIKICKENNIDLISIFPDEINEFNMCMEKIENRIKLHKAS